MSILQATGDLEDAILHKVLLKRHPRLFLRPVLPVKIAKLTELENHYHLCAFFIVEAVFCFDDVFVIHFLRKLPLFYRNGIMGVHSCIQEVLLGNIKLLVPD